MSIDFGLSLPSGPRKDRPQQWLHDLDTAIPMLEKHFKSLWMTDHFFWDDDPTYEAWTTICYVAARWPQFDIGPMVLGQGYRNPALLAKMGATLQNLSGGRLIMALGTGWKEDEYRAYGYGYPSPGMRLEQLEDALEIIKQLWSQPGKVAYQGKHYGIEDAYCEPKPDPVPPLIVGGGGKKTMLLAAKYADWWNLHDANFIDYANRLAVLSTHCDTIGRDRQTLRLTWFGRLVVHKSEPEAVALTGGKWTKENAIVGTPTQVLDQLNRFIDAGVDYFMIEVPGINDPEIQALLVNDIFAPLSEHHLR